MWRKIVLLWLLSFTFLVAACRKTAEPQTPAPEASAQVNSEISDCKNQVPDDRRFPLPPWGKTNFCRHTVSYDEFRSGGVSRDRIPAIDDPVFQTVDEAGVWLADVEPVMSLELMGQARAYPLQVLVWHEIVNDSVAGVPVVITYCPLCSSGLIFERMVNDQVLDFGTTGNIRNADLVMYDRQTESWWQQFTGEALVGDFTGARLTLLPSRIISFAEFRDHYPAGQVLFPDTGYERLYGETPYINYDSLVNPGTKYLDGEADGRLPPKMRVMVVDIGGQAMAYPYDLLSDMRVINDTFNGQELVVFWKSGTVTALYSPVIAESPDVGSAAVFSRVLNGKPLTFVAEDERFVDEQTGTVWNLFGTAVAGPLTGERLTSLDGHEFLWFGWAAFRPETGVYPR